MNNSVLVVAVVAVLLVVVVLLALVVNPLVELGLAPVLLSIAAILRAIRGHDGGKSV